MKTSLSLRTKWPLGLRLLATAIGGALVGFLLALLGGFAGARLLAAAANGWGDLVYGILGAMIGYTIGVSLGVYVLGRRLLGGGSFWLALLGSVLAVALVLLMAEPLRLNTSAALLQVVLAVLTPLLATIGLRLKQGK